MTLWKTRPTIDQLAEKSRHTLVEHLGIEFLEIGDTFLKARMPVDYRTVQPAGVLHGGASAALAETLGSIAASLCVDRDAKTIVGLEINANHVRAVKGGWVTGVTTPIHIGKSTHVWDIRIYDDKERLVCISRLTVAVVSLPEK
jgi:1,4-dihydroxy-2-naphthoyl-CoA hydrolase